MSSPETTPTTAPATPEVANGFRRLTLDKVEAFRADQEAFFTESVPEPNGNEEEYNAARQARDQQMQNFAEAWLDEHYIPRSHPQREQYLQILKDTSIDAIPPETKSSEWTAGKIERNADGTPKTDSEGHPVLTPSGRDIVRRRLQQLELLAPGSELREALTTSTARLNDKRQALAELTAKRNGRWLTVNNRKYNQAYDEYQQALDDFQRAQLAEKDLTNPNRTEVERKADVDLLYLQEDLATRKLTNEKTANKKINKYMTKFSEFMRRGKLPVRVLKTMGIGAAAGAVGVGIAATAGGLVAVGGLAAAGFRAARVYAMVDAKKGHAMSEEQGDDLTQKLNERHSTTMSPEDYAKYVSNVLKGRYEDDSKNEQKKRRRSAGWGLGAAATAGVVTFISAYDGWPSLKSPWRPNIKGWINREVPPIKVPDGPDNSFMEKPNFENPVVVPNNEDLWPRLGDINTPEPNINPNEGLGHLDVKTPHVTDGGHGMPETTGGAEAGYNYGALHIHKNEGLYETFRDLGVEPDQRDNLLEKVGPSLVDQGVAYRDPSIGGYGLNMTKDGLMPTKALDTIVDVAHDNGIDTNVSLADTGAAEAGNYSEAALSVAHNEGWDQTMQDLKINRSNWDAILTEAGPKLDNLNYADGTPVAYYDNVAREYRINMPDNGKMPKRALDILTSINNRHNWDWRPKNV